MSVTERHNTHAIDFLLKEIIHQGRAVFALKFILSNKNKSVEMKLTKIEGFKQKVSYFVIKAYSYGEHGSIIKKIFVWKIPSLFTIFLSTPFGFKL